MDLFALLQSEHGDVGSLKLLSTHPLTEEMMEGQGSVREDAELERKWEGIEGF